MTATTRIAMNDGPPREKRSFQFGIRAMLIATAVLAAFLSLLKWIGCPTIVIVAFVIMLAADLLLIAGLLLVDSAWFKRKAARDESREDPEP